MQKAGFRRRTTLIVAGGCLIFLVALALVTAPADADRVPESTPLVVRTLEAVEADVYEVERHFVGRLEAARESAVGFEIGGRVTDVRVDEGDRVAKGALLARLDRARLEARRAELVAVIDEAQAAHELATSTRDRVLAAHRNNAVSAQRLDESERELQARLASLRRAEAALASLDVDLDKSSLRAPFDAIVAVRHVDEGQVIEAGRPVLELFERQAPVARIGISESRIDALVVGEGYRVRVGDRELSATLRAIAPQLDGTTRSVDALFIVDSTLDTLSRGALVRLALTEKEAGPGIWLPLGALAEGQRGLWSCFVAEATDGELSRLARRELILLHQEEERVFVRGTLRAGERVVGDGVHRLTQGLEVRVEAMR